MNITEQHQNVHKLVRAMHNQLGLYEKDADEAISMMNEGSEMAGWANIARAKDAIEQARKLLRTALGELGASIAQEGLE